MSAASAPCRGPLSRYCWFRGAPTFLLLTSQDIATPLKKKLATILSSLLPKLALDALPADRICSDPAVVRGGIARVPYEHVAGVDPHGCHACLMLASSPPACSPCICTSARRRITLCAGSHVAIELVRVFACIVLGTSVTHACDMRQVSTYEDDPLVYHGGLRCRFGAECLKTFAYIERNTTGVQWYDVLRTAGMPWYCALLILFTPWWRTRWGSPVPKLQDVCSLFACAGIFAWCFCVCVIDAGSPGPTCSCTETRTASSRFRCVCVYVCACVCVSVLVSLRHASTAQPFSYASCADVNHKRWKWWITLFSAVAQFALCGGRVWSRDRASSTPELPAMTRPSSLWRGGAFSPASGRRQIFPDRVGCTEVRVRQRRLASSWGDCASS